MLHLKKLERLELYVMKKAGVPAELYPQARDEIHRQWLKHIPKITNPSFEITAPAIEVARLAALSTVAQSLDASSDDSNTNIVSLIDSQVDCDKFAATMMRNLVNTIGSTRLLEEVFGPKAEAYLIDAFKKSLVLKGD